MVVGIQMGLPVDAAVSLLALALLTTQLQALRAFGVVRSSREGNQTRPSAATLAHCRTSCGNLSFQYPFGIGRGCFRDRDFELICNESTKPSKLFLHDGTTQVVGNVSMAKLTASYIYDKATYILGNSMVISFTRTVLMSSGVSDYHMTWEAPGGSYSFWKVDIKLVGCDFDAHLIDRKSGAIMGYCASSCLNEEIMEMAAIESCNNTGCCKITGGKQDVAFHLNIVRRSKGRSVEPRYKLSSIRDRISVIADSLPVTWTLVDQPTCDSSKPTYACIDNNSECRRDELLDGYSCICKDGYIGNPYILNGCSNDQGYNPIQVRADCTRRCGNISVPFPFGLEEGCSARKIFQLSCSNASSSTLLLNSVLSSGVHVTEIDVGQGLIQQSGPYASASSQWANGLFISSGTHASATLRWAASKLTCSAAKQNSTRYACRSEKSKCMPVSTEDDYIGYRCKCVAGFEGNPYIPNGCQDINECFRENTCKGICHNTIGSYFCFRILPLGILIGLSGGFIILLLMFSAKLLIRRRKSYIRKKEQKKYFQKNHGLLLEQLLTSNENASDKTKIFSLKELEKATNNFDPMRILGCGGHGMVYKGILSDQRVVAIKKSNVIKDGEINQFINEVAILSQINHRNIVNLFGCCLETEVPLLVYDFVPNGSLFEILHDDTNNGFSLSWDNCLRIAAEAAGALYYLHSSASISIFHRDVKSSNILLDVNYTAKVSDFGASRSVPIDQTHVVTNIQGTFGYLDPEYYRSGELNEKSDVYSFGVMLVELLLKRKPIFVDESGLQQNLSQYFLREMSVRPIREIVSAQVLEEAAEDEINGVCSLAEMCLRLRGDERPTMKEVEMALQHLRTKQLNNGKTGPGNCREDVTIDNLCN